MLLRVGGCLGELYERMNYHRLRPIRNKVRAVLKSDQQRERGLRGRV
jgi:hypothetical protein